MNGSDQTGASASGHKIRSFGGREVLLDQDGFLVDPRAWSEEVTIEMACEQGLKVIEEPHWKTIRFLREYYFAHGKAPLSREIRKGTGLSLMEIEHLFPGGLKEGARRMAGLPNARGCM